MGPNTNMNKNWGNGPGMNQGKPMVNNMMGPNKNMGQQLPMGQGPMANMGGGMPDPSQDGQSLFQKMSFFSGLNKGMGGPGQNMGQPG